MTTKSLSFSLFLVSVFLISLVFVFIIENPYIAKASSHCFTNDACINGILWHSEACCSGGSQCLFVPYPVGPCGGSPSKPKKPCVPQNACALDSAYNGVCCPGLIVNTNSLCYLCEAPNKNPSCSPNAISACSNDDLYWYDSCGNKGAKKEECGKDSYGAWSDPYCSNGDLWRTREFHNRGCASKSKGSSCFDKVFPDTEKLKDCVYGCSNGKCNLKPTPDYITQGLATSPGNLISGQNVTFSTTIKNTGKANATSNSVTRLRIDIGNNKNWDITPSNKTTSKINSGASEVETWTSAWIAQQGTHRFEVCADINNQVIESNEDNNCTTQTFNVALPPNNPPTASNPSASLSVNSGPICLANEVFSWTFSDLEDGTTQSAYQLQVDNNSDFSSPEANPGKVNSSSITRVVSISSSPISNQLSFNTPYYWRVRVYDSQDSVSSWVNGPNFTTLLRAYPQPAFTLSPSSPSAKQTTIFTDQTTFFVSNLANRSWSWIIQDVNYVDGTNSSSQNPHVQFQSKGSKSVSLTAIDKELENNPNSGNGQCSISSSVSVSLPIPEFEEIPPFSFLDIQNWIYGLFNRV